MSERQQATSEIVIAAPDDFHVHVRQGKLLSSYVRTLARQSDRALIMPNTVPPVSTPDGLNSYRGEIVTAAPHFTPLMSFMITESLEPDSVAALASAGAVAGKYYPSGVTTNSADGVSDPRVAEAVFASMEREALVLCIHAEDPAAGVLVRERAFHPQIEWIVDRFPRLRIVIEHVSDARTVKLVQRMPMRVAATVTVHHLLHTIDDLLGSGIRPHLYCKPILKSENDRAAIQEAVLSGNTKFFYGSDSAPHPQNEKESACGAAGVYSTPVALPLLLDFFEEHGELDRLEPFVAEFGADFYGLPRSTGRRRFIKERWRVPSGVDGAVPLSAASEIGWRPDSDAAGYC